MDNRWQRFVFLSALVAILYYPIVDYGFIQDDWLVINRMVNGRWAEMFTPGTFWRPLPLAYMAVMYKVFGLWPFAFHVASVLLLGGIGVLVYDLARRNLDAFRSSCVAVMFLSATNILFEPMAWMVGAYDLFGLLFVLLTVKAVLNRKWYRAIAFGVCAILSRFVVMPAAFQSAADHPYHIGLGAITLNLEQHLSTLVDAVSPIDGLGVWLLLPLLLTRSSRNWKLTGLILLAVLPLLLVTNHRCAYYAAYAAIPFFLLVVNFLNKKILVAAVTVLCLVSGFAWTVKYDKVGARKFNTLFFYKHEGASALHIYNDGRYNELSMKSREYKFMYDVMETRGVPDKEIPTHLVEWIHSYNVDK